MADFNRRSVERRSASLASMAALSSCARRSSMVMRSAGSSEVAQRVADLRRLFVILQPYRFVECVLELFPFRERAFGLDLFEPGFQRVNFSALFQQVLPRMLPVKSPDLVEAVLDHLDGFAMTILAQCQHALGADSHHQQLRRKLLQRPGEFV